MEHAHYDRIAATLVAGDVQARSVHNESGTSVIVVGLAAGGEVVWGNCYIDVAEKVVGQEWSATVVDAEGVQSGLTSDLAPDADPEDVARLVATFDYPSPLTSTEVEDAEGC